ncbi:MAG: type II toxin-antitoxin system MqsA family antitoxin [Desulfobacteraceae bacterium]|nr:type II toxin-antitoxin system MqsA family antitoxin [Desulfobacteraceae bacterium]
MKKCIECGGKTVPVKDQPYLYDECGLDVILHGVTQFKCEQCGEIFVSLPNIENLHRVIGGFICSKRKSLLTPSEIKFLRKDLHLKSKELASVLGLRPETVSRWERGKETIGETQDRLLRSLYMNYAAEKVNSVICHGLVQIFSELPRERKKIKSPKKIELNPSDWLTGRVEVCEA